MEKGKMETEGENKNKHLDFRLHNIIGHPEGAQHGKFYYLG